jgi:beta-galactosidase GanA
MRLAESAWARLESRQERHDFAWLDSDIDWLSEQGMQSIPGKPAEPHANPVLIRRLVER